MTGPTHSQAVLKLENTQPAAVFQLLVQWTDWGHIWGHLICKSNEAPEIESYGARRQVSRPANRPVLLLVLQEAIMKESKCSGFDLWLWTCHSVWHHSNRTCTFNAPHPCWKVSTGDAELDVFLSGFPMTTMMSVKRRTRSQKMFRFCSLTQVLCTEYLELVRYSGSNLNLFLLITRVNLNSDINLVSHKMLQIEGL